MTMKPQDPEEPRPVGYCQPPQKTQFNSDTAPRGGRKPGSKNKPKRGGLTESEQAALEESQRIVSDKHKLSAVRLVDRAQIKTAGEGGTMAQKHYLERIGKLEQKKWDWEQRSLDHWEEYVRVGELILARATPEHRKNIEPLMLPHPHDVEVDFIKRTVRIFGPATTLERRHWNEYLDIVADFGRQVLEMRPKLEGTSYDEGLQIWYEYCFFYYCDARDRLPQRYKPAQLPLWTSQRKPKFWRIDAELLELKDELCALPRTSQLQLNFGAGNVEDL